MKLPPKELFNIGLRLLLVSGLLGPAALGVIVTIPIYFAAVVSGEPAFEKLMLFPFGMAMAFFFAFVPAMVLAALILFYRAFLGPLTVLKLASFVWPCATILAAFAIRAMSSSQGNVIGDVFGALVSGAFYAVLVTGIVCLFWMFRARFGLSDLD